uniref:Reverse transcriptase domain-containing protein n=1 Tax=Micrurus paraensis TaxID=1970185 RepID=A0A2D4JTU8_9SAUR
MLEERITMMELTEAIKKQKNGKAPGLDGIPAEMYKTLQDSLSNTLLEVVNEVLMEAKIPKSWMEAYIALILKEDTDLQIKNYRPISLLNSDYKIFASIMAERLKRFLNQFIHIDQIKDNMRINLNTLEYYEAHPEKQMALIFLDAQKAFDNVNWKFMLAQMEEMDFGERFIKMIKTL